MFVIRLQTKSIMETDNTNILIEVQYENNYINQKSNFSAYSDERNDDNKSH